MYDSIIDSGELSMMSHISQGSLTIPSKYDGLGD